MEYIDYVEDPVEEVPLCLGQEGHHDAHAHGGRDGGARAGCARRVDGAAAVD